MKSKDSHTEPVDLMTDMLNEPHQITVSDTYEPNVDVVLFDGDCSEFLKDIPSSSVDLIITSPPYEKTHPYLLQKVKDIIFTVDALHYKIKESKEITMPGKMLYSPPALNRAFAQGFGSKGSEKKRVTCHYSTDYYRPGYLPKQMRPAYREMDFLKGRLGIEIQFGKYAFMVYNVCAKMTIFRNLGYIDAGVEVVPVKSFADEMSTGVSYFEQFV